MEIVEDRPDCPFVRLLFDDAKYYAAVSIADTSTIYAANAVLWRVLHQVLDTYQPRAEITRSREIKPIEPEGEP